MAPWPSAVKLTHWPDSTQHKQSFLRKKGEGPFREPRTGQHARAACKRRLAPFTTSWLVEPPLYSLRKVMLTVTAQGHNASMQNLGKCAPSEEEGRQGSL